MVTSSIRTLVKRAYVRLAGRRQIAAYLSATKCPRLNLGCGYNVLDGWMNVDLEGGRHGTIFMDATSTWPLPDNAFDAILCEHMIEHVPKDAGIHLLAEAFRVLLPGGRIRVITPDLSAVAKLVFNPAVPEYREYLEFLAKFHDKAEMSGCDAVNVMFYCYGHKYIYTRDELKLHFRLTGFDDVVESRGGQPVHALFYGVEDHPNLTGLKNAAMEAFAIEAIKPSARARDGGND
jgi:predicted SAM-dependent methyltransferase